MDRLLGVEDLRVSYYSYRGVVHALNGVSLDIMRQETVGLVGETGCGKSTVGLSIVGLIPNPGKVDSGRIVLDGENLLEKSKDKMRELRRTKLALVFQDPSTSLNPVLRIGNQLAEALMTKRGVNRNEAREIVLKMLGEVGIFNPKVAQQFPHELSGGMKQRVMIAMALTGNPEMLIADEPTSSLDVTLQAQIMELLADLSRKNRMAVLLITHNMGLVSQYCERVAVMYAGNIAEVGDIRSILKSPAHPYTKGLLNAVRLKSRNELTSIPGAVPDLINLAPGCSFALRCGYAMDVCTTVKPELMQIQGSQSTACYLYAKEGEKAAK